MEREERQCIAQALAILRPLRNQDTVFLHCLQISISAITPCLYTTVLSFPVTKMHSSFQSCSSLFHLDSLDLIFVPSYLP